MVCRICKSINYVSVINLGNQVLTSRFPLLGDTSTPSGMMELIKCQDCGLVQLKDTIECNELYEHQYGYRSGLTETMRNHLQQYNSQLQYLAKIKNYDYVLDIGSNDATFLKFYPPDVNKIGIDPTGKQFIQYYDGVRLIPTYFTKQNLHNNYYSDIKYKAVSSIAMFYDLPDPVQFAKDIHDILEDDGVWTFEQSYILTMLQKNSFETICHEHLEYYSVKQIVDICNQANLKIIDISLNESNGGSFRIFACKKDSSHEECADLIHQFLEKEKVAELDKPETYFNFMKSCDHEISKLQKFIDIVNSNGKETWIYGASTKGNTLLQYAKLDFRKIKYAVERNPEKIGKMTPGTNIEIISEETMRRNPPKCLLVLPWHFKEEIIKREKEYLDNGGCLIFPLPKFSIISRNPKLLVTGIDGQIGCYIKREFKDHEIFGITRNIFAIDPEILKIKCDVQDSELDVLLSLIEPSKIIHLASITNTEKSNLTPIDTINTNGMVISRICEFVTKNSMDCKIFNASSSEIYKGHQTYLVIDNDKNYNSYNPYSYGKLLGHQMVTYYAEKYSKLYSNGIIFMTESKERSEDFLLKKVVNHLKSWKSGARETLSVSSLESFRTIQHASDVACAIRIILEQDISNNYVICGNECMKMLDIVMKLCDIMGLTVKLEDNRIIDLDTNLCVIEIDSKNIRSINTNILGEAKLLKELGWEPMSLKEVLQRLVE